MKKSQFVAHLSTRCIKLVPKTLMMIIWGMGLEEFRGILDKLGGVSTKPKLCFAFVLGLH